MPRRAVPYRRLESIAAGLDAGHGAVHRATWTSSSAMSAPPPAGVVPPPTRTSDAAEAFRLAREYGASILRTERFGDEVDECAMRLVAASLPQRIFGAALAQHKLPERIAGGGWDGKAWRGHRVSGPDRGHIPNAPHQDHNGGELKQDYFLMVCAEVPEHGGESFMLCVGFLLPFLHGVGLLTLACGPVCQTHSDGYGLLDGLGSDLRDAMFNVPTQHGDLARSPCAQWTGEL